MPPEKYSSSFSVKRIGIIGCGAMGSAIARILEKRLAGQITIGSLTDIIPSRAHTLSKSLSSRPKVVELAENIEASDVVIESASASVSSEIAQLGLKAGKDVLIMSVGGLFLNGWDHLAKHKQSTGHLFVPSGAIGGLDALGAIGCEQIESVLLKTRKPPQGLSGVPYLEGRGIDVRKIKELTRVFSGNVEEAVKFFPQNINVAASIALALHDSSKLQIEIYCDPTISRNIHEITASGSFGRFSFTTENVPSPENPKTSHLAVLSAVSAVEKILGIVRIGT